MLNIPAYTTDTILSTMYLTNDTAIVSFHPHLLAICP